MQKTAAAANFKTGMLDILSRAEVDPDHNSSAKYASEIEQLKRKSLKGFATKAAETETAIEFDYEAKVGQIKIENLFKKKTILVGQTASMQLIDAEINNPTDQSLSIIRKELNKQVAAGIFDPKYAYEQERAANRALGVNRISKDLYQAETPEDVDAISDLIIDGFYEKGGVVIKPADKKNLLELADRTRANVEKKLQAQYAEAVAQNRVQTVLQVAKGEFDFSKQNIATISEEDPQLGIALMKAKDFLTNYNPKIPQEEQRVSMAGVLPPNELMKARSYAKSVNDVFMQNDNERLGEFVLRELEKKSDGTNSSIKLAAFMQLASLKRQANNPQSQQDFDAADRVNAIKAGVKFLQASNPFLAPITISEFIVKNYFSGGKTKKQVMLEARRVLEDKIIERHASVAKLNSMPNKIIDGEASVEDLHAGLNDLEGESFNGDYADQDRGE